MWRAHGCVGASLFYIYNLVGQAKQACLTYSRCVPLLQRGGAFDGIVSAEHLAVLKLKQLH